MGVYEEIIVCAYKGNSGCNEILPYLGMCEVTQVVNCRVKHTLYTQV